MGLFIMAEARIGLRKVTQIKEAFPPQAPRGGTFVGNELRCK